MSRATSTHPFYDPQQKQRLPPGLERTSSSGPVAPMSIPQRPGARQPVIAPPPLPPPTHLSEADLRNDLGHHLGELRHKDFPSRPPRPGSSLLGPTTGQAQGKATDASAPELTFARRKHIPSLSGEREAGGSGLGSKLGMQMPPIDSTTFHSQAERELGQKSHQTVSNAYDKQLLSKIGGPNTAGARRSEQPRSLDTPDLSYGSSLHSPPSRWPPDISSPGGYGSQDHIEIASADSSYSRRPSSISWEGGKKIPGKHESGLSPLDGGDLLESLNLVDERSPLSDDPVPRGRIQRLASPHRETAWNDQSLRRTNNEQYLRTSAQLADKHNSPASRYDTVPTSVSVSSSSAAPSYAQHGGSLASHAASLASSATSFGDSFSSKTFDFKMPMSTVNSELGPHASPYTANPSSRDVFARRPQPPQHQRVLSDHELSIHRKMPQDGLAHTRPTSTSKVQGHFICECCPKKPKKFESEEELRTHELEKQYTCLYCPNRFKNKNEAERHQNSLHLRRHSWSCAALAGVHAAFHPSTTHSGSMDVCGYCGEEFPNPPNPDIRGEHLNHVHKFGECNQAKKFFRADHFRQHLKHSHAGTSGKWTNQLENACMKDEPLPKERVTSERSASDRMAAERLPSERIFLDRLPTERPPTERTPTERMPPPTSSKPSAIGEVPHES